MACACAPDTATRAEFVPAKVTGIITILDSEAIDEVNGFTLKQGDQLYEIKIDPELDYGFALGHLSEHVGGDPVTVAIEERAGTLYALSIEDAPVDGSEGL
ncbi:MAG: hypothetical protein M3345_05760 [Actinomycetota bacterium]|nr:hypothetical protein [Actinomycetota bacterium]